MTLLDPLELGLGVSVFIQIQLDEQVRRALDQLETAMSKDPELSKIPGVAHIRSSFALKQVKYQTALPLPKLVSTKRR